MVLVFESHGRVSERFFFLWFSACHIITIYVHCKQRAEGKVRYAVKSTDSGCR